ncbi:MAG: FliH/SctL family protein [bacterium]|nr:FliH/SctL family protein [bacterium]
MSNRIKSDTIQIGNNYVLPIEQSNVTAQQAKVKRIIEETGVKAQSIINGAETKSQAIMQNATNEAEKMIDAAKAQAQEEYNKIVEQAYKEGFTKGENDGLEKFKQDASDALKSLDVLATSSFDVKKNIIDSATLDIVDLVSAIADKVCHIKFDKEVLKRITIDSIKQLREKENITIIVNPELVDNINKIMTEIKEEIPKVESIKIIEDNAVSPDGVIVETLTSRLDSRISSQISEIAQKMLTGANDELE